MQKILNTLLLAVVGSCLLMASTGCNGHRRMTMWSAKQGNDTFTADGIPQKKYLVGGGFAVKYTAPSDGTLMWVEETNHKIIMSQCMEAGEVFEESVPMDEEGKAILGDDLTKVRLTLYFVPAKPAEEEKEEN